MADTPTGDRLGIDVDVQDLPGDRKKRTIDADQDSLFEELALVADRHNADLSRVEICQALFDFADSYASAWGLDLEVEQTTDHNDDPVALVHFRDDEDVLPAPVGAWNPNEDPGQESPTGISRRGGRAD